MVAIDIATAVIGLLIALTQAIIAFYLIRLTRNIHSNQVKLQRLLKLQEWGNECIDSLAEADHFFASGMGETSAADDRKLRKNLLARLSSLIDQGRIFFENVPANSYGAEKLPAYRGLRPKILDPLIAVYRAIKNLDQRSERANDRTSDRLFEWRKYFVSLLQREAGEEWRGMKSITGHSELRGGGAGDSIDEHSVAPSDI